MLVDDITPIQTAILNRLQPLESQGVQILGLNTPPPAKNRATITVGYVGADYAVERFLPVGQRVKRRFQALVEVVDLASSFNVNPVLAAVRQYLVGFCPIPDYFSQMVLASEKLVQAEADRRIFFSLIFELESEIFQLEDAELAVVSLPIIPTNYNPLPFNPSPVPLNYGGTGADNAQDALTNLGIKAPHQFGFAFGDASPRLLYVAGLVRTITLDIDRAFDGAGPSITVGTIASPDLLMGASTNDPLTVGSYEISPSYSQASLAAGLGVYLSIVPGSGCTQGSGVIYLQEG
jgi:hypothetical protein